ncbi:hypothetical protein [Pseudonocardia sp. McavD-2-B]|uniref:hypothetical protein n=1 Tax=Pseudonocardia sp. McavD-2-B TaxID=2954499 RepID=UPI0020971AF6|nr:hypothetical protein [Pseudonocardia sp. McavD-2-B]MCO7192015.1 hypothetical protein [Pseudonocardia sp. McavD-2-B]
MNSQTSAPQSRSRHASFSRRAASAADGGCGSGGGFAGGETNSTGFTDTHRHRTPREYAPLSTKWMCRMVAGASGRQRCGRHRSSHSCSRGVRWSTRFADPEQ